MLTMRAYVGVTDGDWFRFLRDRPQLDEVNFWKPGSGSGQFRALDPGELFLFKLHASDGGAVVGGATFMCSSRFPAWVAWEAFGEKNGAVDFPQMRARIERYRREPIGQGEVEIGCLILREPFFFEESDWIPAPRDWRPSTQQGKGYDLTSGIGRELWDAVSDRWVRANAASVEIPSDPSVPMFREALGRLRLGQGSFRLMVIDAYERRCAVTREKALPALQAAHIRPVTQGGLHQIANALLLRSDVHALYDHGYVTITPELEFRVSRRLHTDFDNGKHYVALEGTELWLPRSPDDFPNRDSLEWHADEIFLR
jgi:putative restriction endonuclease